MTEKEYRTHPAISRSELWRLNDSPEKFKWFKDNPEPAGPALLFGQVVHKLLLEAKSFGDEFAVAPDVDRRTKEGKAVWREFELASVGKSIVSADMFDQAMSMVKKAYGYDAVKRLLDGEHEVPFFWTDEMTGEKCKCRTDSLMIKDGTAIIVDYKTAESADTRSFNSKLFKYGYHFQAGMYSVGVQTALNLPVLPKFIFIVQEKKPPYSVNIISVPDDVMQYGIDVYRELLGVYHTCKKADYWYGYTGPLDEFNEAYLPGWIGGEE
jgi:hypothetical protein